MGAYKRDTKGIAKILHSSSVERAVAAKAEGMAKWIHEQHPDLEPAVHTGHTDRAVATLTVARGAELQATEGLFTRAAAANGLEVKRS